MGVLDSYIQLGIESAWGTERTTGLKKVPVKGYGVVPELQTFASEMQAGAAGVTAIFNGAVLNDGSFGAELTYNALDWLYYLLLGTKNVAGNGTTVSYTKIFSPATTTPSATIQKSLGNIPTGKVYTDLGVKCNVMEVAFDAAAGIGQITAELTSKQEKGTSGGDTASSSGLTTITPIPIQLAAEATIWNPGISTGTTPDTRFCVLSGRIRYDRRLPPGPICLGSVTPRERRPNKPILVTANLRVLFDSGDLYELFKAKGANTAFRMKWVGAVTGLADAASYTTDFLITRSRLKKAMPALDTGADDVIADIVLEGYGNAGADATAEPCNITTVNLESGAYLA